MFTVWLKRMVRQKVDLENFDKITNLTEVKNMLTAIADEIRQKSKLEGKLEGKLEERLTLAKKMKDLGYSMEEISKVIGLRTDEIAKL